MGSPGTILHPVSMPAYAGDCSSELSDNQLCTTPVSQPIDVDEACDGEGSDTSVKPMPNEALKKRFNDRMDFMPPLKEHQTVAVLMLYWEVVRQTDMDVAPEVAELRGVLEGTYNYTVWTRTLDTKRHSKPEHQLAKHLSDFIEKWDREYALLIVYYAGHGVKAKGSGDLYFTQADGLKDLEESRTKIVWTESESRLHATDADKLVIFDCCHAGAVEQKWRSPNSDQMFDFIGSTGGDGKAIGPGKRSFTTALTWALKELAGEPYGFTRQTLLRKTWEAPDFYHGALGNTPVGAEYGKKPVMYNLRLRPLSKETVHNVVQVDVPKRVVEPFPYRFILQFVCTKRPSEDNITDLCKGLKRTIKNHDLPFGGVFWISHWDREEVVKNVLERWPRPRSVCKPGTTSGQPPSSRHPQHTIHFIQAAAAVAADDVELQSKEVVAITNVDHLPKQPKVQLIDLRGGSIISFIWPMKHYWATQIVTVCLGIMLGLAFAQAGLPW